MDDASRGEAGLGDAPHLVRDAFTGGEASGETGSADGHRSSSTRRARRGPRCAAVDELLPTLYAPAPRSLVRRRLVCAFRRVSGAARCRLTTARPPGTQSSDHEWWVRLPAPGEPVAAVLDFDRGCDAWPPTAETRRCVARLARHAARILRLSAASERHRYPMQIVEAWSDEAGRRCAMLLDLGTAPAPLRALMTPRQVEVAGLAAAGASDREIAEHLRISARTVANHLRAAYAALQVVDRAELLNRWLEHSATPEDAV